MAETRVDLLHLLEDLRDAYPGALEETVSSTARTPPTGARRRRAQRDITLRFARLSKISCGD
jgi:hypothetical protein